jgi:hypothetical protein
VARIYTSIILGSLMYNLFLGLRQSLGGRFVGKKGSAEARQLDRITVLILIVWQRITMLAGS